MREKLGCILQLTNSTLKGVDVHNFNTITNLKCTIKKYILNQNGIHVFVCLQIFIIYFSFIKIFKIGINI